jgi:hypothetical protein
LESGIDRLDFDYKERYCFRRRRIARGVGVSSGRDGILKSGWYRSRSSFSEAFWETAKVLEIFQHDSLL